MLMGESRSEAEMSTRRDSSGRGEEAGADGIRATGEETPRLRAMRENFNNVSSTHEGEDDTSGGRGSSLGLEAE